MSERPDAMETVPNRYGGRILTEEEIDLLAESLRTQEQAIAKLRSRVESLETSV
jgi:hypothetical protein